MKQQKEICII